MELRFVDFQVRDGIGFITMNNPEKMNAFTLEGAQSLTRCLEHCSDSGEVRAVVIRGAGGSVCGGGDINIAQEDAKFVFAFVNIGFVPDMGSNLLLARAVGKVKAAELVMLGSRFSGREAADWGLITRAVPAQDLEGEVRRTAERLAAGPTLAYARMKKLINRVQYENLENIMANEGEYQQQLCKSADHAEAIHAFFEKRRPSFQGR